MKKINTVSLIFLVLAVIGWCYSGLSLNFLMNEILTRFIRNGLIVLALLLPIAAGMGLNFAVVIGALCAQVGFILVINWQVYGMPGLLLAVMVSTLLSLVMGYFIGLGLNRVRGREMITTIIIGFLGVSLYQLIFMVGFGTFITPGNPDIILTRGIGVRDMVDLAPFRNIMEDIWLLEIGMIKISVFMILFILLFCMLISYLMNTRLGQQFKAVGEDSDRAEMLGLNVNALRIKAMIISTVIACLGQIFYVQNIGMLGVYSAHKNSEIFSCAALLAGGATIKKASVWNVIFGIFLFHSLIVVSPHAGQKILGNPALGEYFRSFLAYGTIAAALIINIKRDLWKEKKNSATGNFVNSNSICEGLKLTYTKVVHRIYGKTPI
ncbi:ABC transporter permease subunit [Candidatus Contubernalis alkaliaceticus]|uniref:ABC transporter permease subunit n=1 Tax=Candidatus Contubernalis alkaliaceticus TaxID=338645 RepID=UPI001F4C36A5|nr:ABC transporter permease [Candidatus Contubernalis alkalaceticus]